LRREPRGWYREGFSSTTAMNLVTGFINKLFQFIGGLAQIEDLR
jgi:hypothetical protein